MKPSVITAQNANWWRYIPVLWLFNRLQDSHQFADEKTNLVWWAETIPALAEEFENRIHDYAVTRDVEIEYAAYEICGTLNDKTPEELFDFVTRVRNASE